MKDDTDIDARSDPMKNALTALEIALLDYVERYGLTPRARDAFDALDKANRHKPAGPAGSE